jgi:hypothetical protein
MRGVRHSGSNPLFGGEYAPWGPEGVTADASLRRRKCMAAHVLASAPHVATARFDVMLERGPRAATGGAEPATVVR